jgi:hypothetical protein
MLGTGGNVTIKSNTTGNTFTLFTTPVTQDEAQQECTAIGGHLASYATLDEQVEMEYAFINSGYLLPGEQPERIAWLWMLPRPRRCEYAVWMLA